MFFFSSYASPSRSSSMLSRGSVSADFSPPSFLSLPFGSSRCLPSLYTFSDWKVFYHCTFFSSTLVFKLCIRPHTHGEKDTITTFCVCLVVSVIKTTLGHQQGLTYWCSEYSDVLFSPQFLAFAHKNWFYFCFSTSILPAAFLLLSLLMWTFDITQTKNTTATLEAWLNHHSVAGCCGFSLIRELTVVSMLI